MSIFPFTDKASGLVFLGPPQSHGEVNLIPIQAIPDTSKRISTENGNHVLGHSESGHHHVLDRVENIERYYDPSSPDIDVPVSAPIRSFLRVIADDVKLTHMKAENAAHRHADQVIPAGNYLVTTSVQYTPVGLRRVAD